MYRRKRLAVRIGHDTASNGRNTVATKRTLHGPFTVVIMTFTTVHSSVNSMVPSFTTVVMLDLGIVVVIFFCEERGWRRSASPQASIDYFIIQYFNSTLN